LGFDTTSFSAVSAALDRLDPGYRQAAESLGAGPVRVLTRVTLPLLLPALGAAAALAVALSMGELGATVVVPGDVEDVARHDLRAHRGQAFQAAACTPHPRQVTLVALVGLGRIRGGAALR
jgi:2-aminoethylphosphonate transport system permease protein